MATGGSGPPAPRSLMALGLLAFLHIGALQATYGPSFAALQARYAVGVGEVGTIVAAHFFGAFLGVALSSLAVGRLGYRTLLIGASALMALGAFAIALAGSWGAALAGAGLAGLGYGLAVAIYNFLFARAFEQRGAAAVNLINGMFGVGAVLAPALVGAATAALLPQGPERAALVTPLVFGAGALLALVVGVVAARVARYPAPPPPRRRGARAGLEPGATARFAALFFVYVAAEVGTAAWAPTHVTGEVGAARAPLAASAFWVAMTLGRFAAAAVAARIVPRDLVLGSVGVGIVGLALAHVPGLALVGYGVAGLGLGPVFPTTVAWVQRRFGDRSQAVGPVVLAAGNLGPVLGAPAIGVAVAATGPGAVPTALALVLVVLAALVVVARRSA